jgi:hypothetical protein
MDCFLNQLLQLLSEEELIRLRKRAQMAGNKESLIELLTDEIQQREIREPE